ncbi:Sodium/calcium exchanger membrane region [Acididesulfobacillus acetoxydans]|uniref:Ca2+/Na+ antiporter n=1 Tax=Acididesulfobacillus acetoxydans TaxID=1561005 RepID=A0A8S0X2R9_9FIRM|nr:sodium:calcium antiporter [Acididesulfobacillus acetoxydans]CAA7599450.1 Sodium/calcium exchanger membrane region [Acididesulfobacillus acetoxydans]CEJ06745.1 Ca2+/Na+ antiporter [Acididesulfobacillus acetoxydans]
MENYALLVLSLGTILAGAGGFTNGVEWLGKKLGLGHGAVGSILAAVGTALPETMVPVIAFLGGSRSGEMTSEIGIGAILGAPLMLSTLAFFISGLAVLIFRHENRPLSLDSRVVVHDLGFFLAVYGLAVMASFLPVLPKRLCALMLLVSYAWYVMRTVRASKGQDGGAIPPPLYLAMRARDPALGRVLTQVAVALLLIIGGAHGFVLAVKAVALAQGVPAFVLSLIITPIATELPEKFNSVVWLRQGKDTLALGNISGAMVFQSSVIPPLGILFTPWHLEYLALWSAVLALLAALLPYYVLKRHGRIRPSTLLLGGGFYLLFILTVLGRKF